MVGRLPHLTNWETTRDALFVALEGLRNIQRAARLSPRDGRTWEADFPRAPTTEMVDAAIEAMGGDLTHASERSVVWMIWQAMYDAALKAEQQP